MGIGFVLLVWILIAGILIVPTSGALGALGWYLTLRKSRRTHVRFTLVGIALPVFGAAYLFGSVIVLGIIGLLSGYDVGFGDGFDVPLPNHYHWSAIDDPSPAKIYDVNDKRVLDGNFEDDDKNAFANVVQIQLAGDWLVGSYKASYDPARRETQKGWDAPDHWFLFNTKMHERLDASNEEQLETITQAHGIKLNLQSCDAFYQSHGRSWLDYVALLALFALLLFLLAKMGRAGWRMWRDDPGVELKPRAAFR